MIRRLAYWSVAVCLAAAGGVSLRAAPAASLTENTITVQGLTPGGGAAFFSVGKRSHVAYYSIRRIAEFVPDDDHDGVVTFTEKGGVPWKSVWFVVDVATGTFVALTPPDFPASAATDRRTIARKDAKGDWSELVHERPWVELLVIRKRDVWSLTAMRGGPPDPTRKGESRFGSPVDRLLPVTPDAKTIKHLNKGDVVIAVDPHHLEHFILEIE